MTNTAIRAFSGLLVLSTAALTALSRSGQVRGQGGDGVCACALR